MVSQEKCTWVLLFILFVLVVLRLKGFSVLLKLNHEPKAEVQFSKAESSRFQLAKVEGQFLKMNKTEGQFFI